MGAVAMLKGPKDYLAKMMQGAELPFTALYFTCLLGTLYGALTSSYIYSVLFSAGQLGALSWYLVTDDGYPSLSFFLCAPQYTLRSATMLSRLTCRPRMRQLWCAACLPSVATIVSRRYFCGAVPGGRGQMIFLNMCMTVTKGMAYPFMKMFK